MKKRFAFGFLPISLTLLVTPVAADDPKPIKVPGDTAFTESITAGPDGSLYVSSFADGGVQRVKPGAAAAEPFIEPAAFGSRSTFGLYADVKSNTLWVCSNDVTGFGVPGPGKAEGSHLLAFDLKSGEGKSDHKFPSAPSLCNDMTVADDGNVYVTDSLAPRILKISPGAKELDVFLEDKRFQPPNGAGLDGIAFGADGNMYVNTFHGGELFRIDVKDGKAGAITKLATSRPISLPDGLRHVTGLTFLMVEGTDKLDRVTIDGDKAKIDTLKDGLKEPTAVVQVGTTAWVAEGQLSHLLDAKKKGPPALPFELIAVPVGE